MQYTHLEQRIDGVVHVLGVAVVGVAVLALLAWVLIDGDGPRVLAAAIYGLGLLASFGFSAAYNMTRAVRVKAVLRRFDHAAIYLLIAGTYTPFAAIAMGGTVGYGLLAVVWTLALVGLVLKVTWPRRFERLALVLYLALGWAGLAVVGSMVTALPLSALVLILVGGLIYTTGVAFHLWRSLRFHNAIWHGCVLVAAGCHYAAVIESIAPR
ncbi:PAQR family membrane homeostasis protein TrhA [Roseospira visakhapatnamensis]|uniref:Hemolysin III n=1 Tax=Roseospira visakhapatnamensis TaxID=390880 RepID=A0A7W6RAX6_9PROT|nr:hemolysin III family protein [Roseospira visakhapatnamensis]MBB4264781.1 hemolysin III [Roseospira visakhapatnamensis]